ncbi:aarF domain-containing protein kinase 1-like isoform X2 [Phoenix dactylifera]|uniref:AarF domain-containing protein kinase 1-like isoform X2 n=1 Tax=Phoenix dactylifera TaxID=42345 RepID=A0A8B9AU01_PHODC|nr:aarF domain-containing protein kinase 1-like isoform X2 [Phoenix dactylifera]
MPSPGLREFQENLTARLSPWHRSFQFWIRAAEIYTGYKVSLRVWCLCVCVCQFRVRFEKDAEKREAMWERQHELAADKMYSLCSELGGLFLKAAQILGKPDLAPAAWVRRLVTLCDKAPATPIEVVHGILEKELGQSFTAIFESFDSEPVGSASIAQVHQARLRCEKTDVAVKVQHPGVQQLMTIDIHNLQAFVLFLQKTDLKFDLFSLTKEVEKQVGYEFDFLREAEAMERIRHSFHANNKKVPVLVPRVIRGMVTSLNNGVYKWNPNNESWQRNSKKGHRSSWKILKHLTLAYGQMILRDGFFHADPHPGNILICKESEVALLDYGQVKQLPDDLRLGYAHLILALADKDPSRATQSYKELGIETLSTCADGEKELFELALKMFDTKLPPGVTMISPFSDSSSLNQVAVQSFPEELYSVLRTMQLLRGLSVGMGINYSCAEQWRPIAEEALFRAGKLKVGDLKAQKCGFWRRIFRRKREYD